MAEKEKHTEKTLSTCTKSELIEKVLEQQKLISDFEELEALDSEALVLKFRIPLENENTKFSAEKRKELIQLFTENWSNTLVYIG